ncbi:MAG: dihydroorotase [Candidatus Omnitrophica bacterium]|nr:dihydroorotase [Candidatus Omnitrophota bacterium]
MKLLIKNARVIDAKSNLDDQLDVLIENSKIVKIAKNIKDKDAQIIDAKDKVLMPGFVDMHVHLREPGYEYKETIKSGTMAAAAGGFTTVCCMPNTNPVIDNQGVVEFVISEARKSALINVYPIGAITKGLKGEELSEIADMQNAGIIAISDDGKGVMNADLMRRALEYASMLNIPVIAHSEDNDLALGGVMNEGYVATKLGLKGIPTLAESTIIARDIEIARYTDTGLHIAHISAKESVALVKRAKKDGLKITCEATPHHFSLTDEAVLGYDTNTKVNPPLRSDVDVQAIKQGLKNGTIDCIATDHAPHAESEKDVEYDHAPFGIIGLETALSLAISELVEPGILTLNQLCEKMAYNPAKILGLDKGYIAEGSIADLVIFDPLKESIISAADFKSKSKNTPFIGQKVKGAVCLTICNGNVVYNNNVSESAC